MQTLSFYYSQYGTNDNGMSGEILGICQQINETPAAQPRATDEPERTLRLHCMERARACYGRYVHRPGSDGVARTVTNSSAYASAANVAYASDGSVIYVGSLGSVYSYSPSYRAFDPGGRGRSF